MGRLTTTFYKDLYRSAYKMDQVLNSVPVKVTAVMNEALIAPFEEKEIKEALFQMFPTKARGPDGFPAHFF
jgi:ribosomal protein L12E/L44/L45/RPP1/RPP2